MIQSIFSCFLSWLMTPSISSLFTWGLISAVGGALVHYIITKNWNRINNNASYNLTSKILGSTERFFFVFAVCFGYPSFPVLWIGLKVGVQSSSWVGDEKREMFNTYLVMNLLTAAIAYICAWGALGFAEYDQLVRLFNTGNK